MCKDVEEEHINRSGRAYSMPRTKNLKVQHKTWTEKDEQQQAESSHCSQCVDITWILPWILPSFIAVSIWFIR